MFPFLIVLDDAMLKVCLKGCLATDIDENELIEWESMLLLRRSDSIRSDCAFN